MGRTHALSVLLRFVRLAVVTYVVGRQRRGKPGALRAEAAIWAAPSSLGGTLRGSF